MKIFFILFILFFSSLSFSDSKKPLPLSFTFDRLSVVDFITTYYSEVEKVSYVLSPDVYTVLDKFGLVYTTTDQKKMRLLFINVLKSAGLEIRKIEGVDYISKIKEQEEDFDIFIYRPKYRDISYFSDLLSTVFKSGRFTFQRSMPAAKAELSTTSKVSDSGSSAFSLQNKSFDILIFNGPKNEILRLETLLSQLDKNEAQVQISAYVYEFSTSDIKKSGVGAIAEILSLDNAIKINVGALATSNALSFSTVGVNGLLNVVVNNISSDGRFKVISRPYLRVKSGGQARFSAGDDVPVLGSAVPDKNGNIIQSVEYKSSGVILDVSPFIRENNIDLTIDQQLSNFIPTSNGVNNSPTLTKRQIKTVLNVKSGEVIVLGGLVTTKNNVDKSRFFDLIPTSTSSENLKSELIIVLEALQIL